MEIPAIILDQLKCAFCKRYLSHPPIYYHPIVGHLCGRHPEQITNGRFVQQRKYEVLASLLFFPCRHKAYGCHESFTITGMAEHEAICVYKPFRCFIRKCYWLGSNSELASHLYERHKPIIVVADTVDIEIVLEKNMKQDIFISALGQYFLVRWEFRKFTKTFHCCVHLINKPPDLIKDHQYEVTLRTRDNNHIWTHEKCPVQSYSYKNQTKDECQIRLDSLNCIAQTPVPFFFGIKFMEVETNLEAEGAENREDQILETIKCPICLEYMVPPIHQCILGHSFCNSCKPKLKKCATCRHPILQTRNFTLEKVTEKVIYHCLYKSDGCDFKTDCTNIQKHQADCKFKIMKCVLSNQLKCNYIGSYSKMYQHCTTAHANYVQRSAYFQLIFDPQYAKFEVYLIKLSFGMLFKLRYAYNDVKVTCSVQLINPPKDNSKYMYEMQIMDLNGTGYELKSKKMCGNLSTDKDDMKYCSIWHMDMMKPFVSKNGQLKFKCVIFKKN